MTRQAMNLVTCDRFGPSSAKAVAASLMGDPSSRGIIYRALRKAADKGTAAPTNRQLADLCGMASVSSPCDVLSALKRDGALAIERGLSERRVTISATGRSTQVGPDFQPISRQLRDRHAAAVRNAKAGRTDLETAFDDRPIRTSHRRAMERGSAMLLQAMLHSDECAVRRREARRSSSMTMLPLDRPTPVLRAAPPLVADRRPVAPNRNPCARCGTRGDLGCAHLLPCESSVEKERA